MIKNVCRLADVESCSGILYEYLLVFMGPNINDALTSSLQTYSFAADLRQYQYRFSEKITSLHT